MEQNSGQASRLAPGELHLAAGTNPPDGDTSDLNPELLDSFPRVWASKYPKRREIKVVDAKMDSILPQLLAFPPHPPPAVPLSDQDYDKQIRPVVSVLNQTSAKKITGGVLGGGDLLEIFDPAVNSVPYLYVLVAHINSAQSGKLLGGSLNKAILPAGTTSAGITTNPGRLWAPIVKFVTQFDPVQVRYAGHEFSQLLAALEQSARQSNLSQEPIQLMASAMLRLDPTGSCFTSNHLNFVRLALDARAWEAAKPILDRDIYAFPYNEDNAAYKSLHPYPCSNHESSSTFITQVSGLTAKLDYKDHLQYFLLGGMLYTGLKDWERALHFYDLAVLTPINQKISKIQLEAYKKRVLVGILATGGPLPMPKTTSTQAAKLYRALAKGYDTIAEVFQEGIVNETDATRLIAEADAGQAVWSEDINEGLMHQVVMAFRRFSVIRLGKVYAALRISDVAQRTSSPPPDPVETANYLKQLIASGQLKGTVTETGTDAGSWVLRFLDDADEELLEAQQLTDIRQAKEKIDNLNARIREADHKMGLTKEYLEWAKKAANQKGAYAVGSEQMGEDIMAIDEDMMVDT